MNHNITINLTDAYRIKIEKSGEFKDSIFSSVYKSAKENLIEILNEAEKNTSNYNANETSILNNSFNNLICFAGERGQGKSSSMISFLKALTEKKKSDDFFVEREITNNRFTTIELIDPSLFKGKETLFEIILAKMFSKFKLSLEEKNDTLQDDDRRKLVIWFQKVFENLKYVNNREDIYKEDSLDALIKLSTSSNLKDSFEKLVSEYLKVMSQGRSSFLVIAIDDFDLKTEGVHDMLEDVRRFLISKNIILLIACKVEQLRQAVEASIYSEFIKQVGYNINILNDIVDSVEIKAKAVKYIDKLIPESRRINLPEVSRLNLKEILKNENSDYSGANSLVLNAIYSRLKLFLKKENFQDSILLKGTLRSLISLLVRLNKTDNFNINNSEGYYQAVLEFKNYTSDFLSTFLDPEEIDLILTSNINLLNFRVIQTLKLYFPSETATELQNIKYYNLIQNGDVYATFFKIETQILDDDNNYNWFQSFKLLYIIRQLLYRIEFSQINTFELDTFNQSSLINIKFIDEVLPRDEGRSRDNFRFTETPEEKDIFEKIAALDDLSKSILASFVLNLGQFRESSFRSLNRNIFDVSLDNALTLEFSLFSFFSAPYTLLNKLRNNYGIKDDAELKKNYIIWKNSKFYYLFNNIDFAIVFYNEFLKNYESLRKDKKFKNLTYYEILQILINEGIRKSFKNLNDIYPYLNLSIENYYEAFPYAKVFVEEENENLKNIINYIYDNQMIAGISPRSRRIVPKQINEVRAVKNIEALIFFLHFLKENRQKRFERKTLEREVKKLDSDLSNIILDTSNFNKLFKSGGNKEAMLNRDKLIIELENLLTRNG